MILQLCPTEGREGSALPGPGSTTWSMERWAACRAVGQALRSWDLLSGPCWLLPAAAVLVVSLASALRQLWSVPGPSPCSVLAPLLDSGEAPPGSEPQFPHLSLCPTPVLQAVGGYEPGKEAQGSACGPPVSLWSPRAGGGRAGHGGPGQLQPALTSGSRVWQAAGVGVTAALTREPGADRPRPGTQPVNR